MYLYIAIPLFVNNQRAGDEWSDCFTLSPIILPSAPFLGFSAMTGDVFDTHEYAPFLTFCAVSND
jgi:mannose-binding lectin 2